MVSLLLDLSALTELWLRPVLLAERLLFGSLAGWYLAWEEAFLEAEGSWVILHMVQNLAFQ